MPGSILTVISWLKLDETGDVKDGVIRAGHITIAEQLKSTEMRMMSARLNPSLRLKLGDASERAR